MLLLSIALIGQAATGAPALAPQATIEFQIGGVALEIPKPRGYCLPVGQNAAIAQLLAAGDKTNVTHVSLMQCADDNAVGTDDYTLIKTPTTALLATVTRPELLIAVGAKFDKPEFKIESD